MNPYAMMLGLVIGNTLGHGLVRKKWREGFCIGVLAAFIFLPLYYCLLR